MRKIIPVFYFLLFFSNLIIAQNDSALESKDSLATIYIYRQANYLGSGIKMKILCNDLPVIQIKNGSYYSYKTIPGEYYFSCSMGIKARIKINVEPGKNYYISCSIVSGYWSGNPQLELVDSAQGKSIIEGEMLNFQKFEPISMVKPKSRIGINFGGGLGFESIPLFLDENNKKVTLSTGGGFAIGAQYGHKFNKHFDLSVDWLYQSSSLSVPLKNADATYNRMVLAITPALIIPIKGGDYKRFKLGGGIGYYGLGTMHIDASDAGGGDYTCKYKPAFGPHGSLIFEANYSDHGSMLIGIKYYNIKYIYTSEGSTHYVDDSKINKPNGSGLDFLMGWYYHF